jgi:multiple sugar transport system substrate-binding protein/arabinosaccharide transport system substrate-binding protein
MTPPIPPRNGPDVFLSRRGLLRLGATVGGSVALSTLLSACGSPGAGPAKTSGPVNLSFWTHDDGYIKFFGEAVTLADDQTPFDYALNFTKVAAGDIPTKLIAQAVANTGTPDVVGLEIGAFARTLRGDIAAELLVDLNDVVEAQRSDLIGARLAPFSKNGHLYALDSDTPLVVHYYRSDEYQRLGVPVDVETWEDFAAATAGITAAEGVAFGAVATQDPGGTVQSFQIQLLQRGGDLWDENGELNIETSEAEDTLKFISSSLQSGFYTGVADMYGPSMQSGLKASKILGVSMPSWYATFGIKPSVPEQAGLWRVKAMPRFAGGGGRTSVGGGTGFAALRNKPNTKASVDLILATYLDHDQQIKRYRDLGYLPTLRSVFDDPELLTVTDDYFGGQAVFDVYKDVIDEAPAQHQSANAAILQTVLSGYLLRAYNGSLSPAQALRAAASDFRGQARS